MNSNHTLTKGVPSSDDLKFLEDRLYEYNSAKTGRDDGQMFVFFIRDEQQTILAGVSGWTWAQACEIRVLWVDPAWRGYGYGKTLLDCAEKEAQSRGCEVIFLNTYSFQAPEFYKARGYEPVAELVDFPPGHRYHFLIKRLKTPPVSSLSGIETT